MTEKRKVTFKISDYWLEKVDKIVEKRGDSYNRSDFLREIVKDAVKKEKRRETVYEEDTTKNE